MQIKLVWIAVSVALFLSACVFDRAPMPRPIILPFAVGEPKCQDNGAYMPRQSGGSVITDDFVSASAPKFRDSRADAQRAGSYVVITVENTQDLGIAIPIEGIQLTPSGRSFWEFRKTLGEAGRPNALQALRAFDLTGNAHGELRWTKRSADSRVSSKATDTCTGDASRISDVLIIPGKAQRRLVLDFGCNNYARAELTIPIVFPNGARKTYVWELTEIVPSRYGKNRR